MVKFKTNYGAHIAKNLVYLDYDKLKAILHEHDNDDKDKKSAFKPLLLSTVEDWPVTEERFSALFFDQLDKVEKCFVERMSELEYMHVDMMRFAKEFMENKFKKKEEKKAFEAALKRSATTLHQKVSNLETYRILNRTLSLKILQKHDKMTKKVNAKPVLELYLERLNRTSLGSGAKLQTMHAQIESSYAELFCHGILEEAQGKLRLDKTLSDPRILQAVWFKIGAISVLLLWIFYNMFIHPFLSGLYLNMSDPSAYVYAAVAALIVYRWFWGFSVYMWDSVDIDYTLILDLDANKHMPKYDAIYSDAGTLTILYLLNALLFDILRIYYHDDDGTDHSHFDEFCRFWSRRAWIMPLLLVSATLIRIGYSAVAHTSRGVFSFKIFKEMLLAPWVAVHLRHSYAADILCSLNSVFLAVIYSFCYFGSGSYLYASEPTNPDGAEEFEVCTSNPGLVFFKVLIMALPYAIRLTQCLRQRRDHFVRLKMAAEKKAVNEKVLNGECNTGAAGAGAGREGDGSVGVVDFTGSEIESANSSMHPASAAISRNNSQARGVGFIESSALHKVGFMEIPSSPRQTSPTQGTDDYDMEGVLLDTAKFEEDPDQEEDEEEVGEEEEYDDNDDDGDDEELGDRNNYGFDQDDEVNMLEDGRNPLHAGLHQQHMSVKLTELTQRKKTIQYYSSSKNSSDRTIPAEPLGTAAAAASTAAGAMDFSYKSHVSPETAAIELPPPDPKEPKKMRRASSWTISEGMAMTRRIRANVRSTLSRSEVVDYPMPPAVKAIKDFFPQAYSTIMVWPYSYNALRYFFAILVILFHGYPPQDDESQSYVAWFTALYVFSTLFNLYWDIANDFQLLQFSSTRPFLRDNLLYADQESFYYIVLVANSILRFRWLVGFTPYGSQIFLMLFEIMRRSLWACLRMELGYIQELKRRK